MRWYIFGFLVATLVLIGGGVMYFNSDNNGFMVGNFKVFTTSYAENTVQVNDLNLLTRIDVQGSWVVTHQSGIEDNLSVWFSNSKDKKTEIGFIIKEGMTYNTVDKLLYGRDGTPILDDKGKSITLKYETAKCDGQNCYHISLTNAQAVNIDDYVKLGEQSIVLEYANRVNFAIDDFNTITCEVVDNTVGSNINDLNVSLSGTKYKWSAYDNVSSGWESYNATCWSNAYFRQDGDLFYFDEYEYDTSDICNAVYLTGGTDVNSLDGLERLYADCKHSTWYDDTTNLSYVRTTFFSEPFIDPFFRGTVINGSVYPKNMTIEGSNFLHITVRNDTKPWDSLVLLYDFNGLHNNKVYSSTQNNVDLTITNANTTSPLCVYGGCFSGDGVSDYLSKSSAASVHPDLRVGENFTFIVRYKQDSSGCVENAGIFALSSSFGVGNPFQLLTRSACTLRMQRGGSTAPSGSTSSITITPNVWHCIAVSNSPENGLTYRIDNTTETVSNISLGVAWGTQDLYVGTAYGTSAEVNGQIDDVMLFNTDIGNKTIGNICNRNISGYTPYYSYGTVELQDANLTLDGDNAIEVNLTGYQLIDGSIDVRINSWNYTNGYDVSDPDILFFYGFNNDSTVDYSNFAGDYASNFDAQIIGTSYNDRGRYGGGIRMKSSSRIESQLRYLDGSTEFTLSIWARFNSSGLTKDGDLFVKGTHTLNIPFMMWRDEVVGSGDQSGRANTISFFVDDGPDARWISAKQNAINDSNWHHIVGTFKAGLTDGIRIYVDGQLHTTGNVINVDYAESTSDYITIGADKISNLNVDGWIDEAIMWNRSLTQKEVARLYTTGFAIRNSTDWYDYTDNVQIPVDNYYTNHLLEINASTGYYSPIVYNQYRFLTTTVSLTDSCTYSSGNWLIDCSDNCVLNTNTVMDASSVLIASGSGTVQQNANITGWQKAYIQSSCSWITSGGSKLW